MNMIHTRLLRPSIGLLAVLALLLTAGSAQAQRDNSETRASPNAKVSQTIGTTVVDMHYSRPGVKGREVFGGLQDWGTVWRAGANEPTTVTFSDDVEIQGQPLEAGTYNIFMRPQQQGDWDVIFTEPVKWGTMFDQAEPVLEVQATPEEAPHQEWLSYSFEDLSDTSANLVMRWDETKVPISISTAQ